MTPTELAQHKATPKRLGAIPIFGALKSGKLPKPLHKLGGPRLKGTGLLDLSAQHKAFFAWRDGEARTDRAFFAYLFWVTPSQGLYPLFILHYHPSHKGLHAKLPCNTGLDYEGRELPGAPELALRGSRTGQMIDPRDPNDRLLLIERFCASCGITLGEGGGLWN
jgi:hypothetical protein